MKNLLNAITGKILKVTGYRFGKEGLFGRGSFGRSALRMIGISCVAANIKADVY